MLASPAARRVWALVFAFGLGCAERSSQVLLPDDEAVADAGGGIFVRLDALPARSEAAITPDGIIGCTGEAESCNGVDDDCDGVVDNGFDLLGDPLNCGACGTVCSATTAVSVCLQGECVVASCIPGYVDADKSSRNGCECLITNGGVERCDNADNDCDGSIDEDFDLQNDSANCGSCGLVCAAANATSVCSRGSCSYTCNAGYHDVDKKEGDGCEYACTTTANPVETCDGVDNDCNGLVDGEDPGMIYAPADRVCYSTTAGSCQAGTLTCIAGKLSCVGAGPPSEEICDGRDNDCDGAVDEADPNVGKTCYAAGMSGCDGAGGACVGQCKRGAYACTDGALVCAGMVVPAAETCDGQDNDCDGTVDNGFDTDNNPNHCGGCGHRCGLPHAIALCVGGVCVFEPKSGQGACVAGWVDRNGDPGDGCEYACLMDGPETCDGRDNDCNGLVDVDDPGLVYPVNFCLQAGECSKGPGGSTHPGWETSASFPSCKVAASAPDGSAPSWVCNYPATVQTTPQGQITAETWCDGLDNDCNGVVDDPHAKDLGKECIEGASSALGACQRKGVLRCGPDRAAVCDFTGVPAAASPTDEICDGVDNDCDGAVDESWDNPPGMPPCSGHDCVGVRDDVVHVNVAGGGYHIYKFEASRPDATGTSQGVSTARACSRGQTASGAAVLPWSSVTWNQADAACRSAGMRLCRVSRSGGTIVADEWGFACRTGQGCAGDAYPYACTYAATACNGSDAGLGRAVACGSIPTCATVGDLDTGVSGEKVFDLSGNLAEWTDDRRDNPELSDAAPGSAATIYTLRGGAYDSFFLGMSCDFTGTQLHPTFAHPDTGFRCCSSCPGGQADCGGVCKNLGSDAANCGACGRACATGTTCLNGVCR